MQEQPETKHKGDDPDKGHDESLYRVIGEAEKERKTSYYKAREYFSKWKNKVATLTLLFVAAYTVLTYCALRNAQDALSSARDQVRVSRDIEYRQLRAYVLVSPELLTPENAAALNLAGHISGQLIVKNSGVTPAYNVISWLGIGLSDYPVPIPGDLAKPNLSDLSVSRGNMGGNGDFADLPYYWNHVMDSRERALLQQGWRALYVFGEVTYDDIFTKSHRCTFRYFISKDSLLGGPGLAEAGTGNDCDKDDKDRAN